VKRLIIRHGARVTQHELVEPVVIGRDKSCDLFFAAEGLSRHHCRVEPTPEGIRLEDLGSSNGCYIGKQRVNVVDLKHDQTVRLGNVTMTVEIRSPEDATTSIPPTTPPRDDGTVMFEKAAPSRPPVETPVPSPPKAPMPVAGPESSPKPPLDKTWIAPKPSKAPAPREKTKLLDVKAMRPPGASAVPDTMMLERDPRPAPSPPAARRPPAAKQTPKRLPPPPSPDDVPVSSVGWLQTLSWSAKFLFIVSTVGIVVYLLLALPLLRSLGGELREESLRRGRALLSVATAGNGRALGEGSIRLVSVDEILREERVKEALILDLEGNVVAPSSRASEVLTSIEGIDAVMADIRTFYLGRRGRDYVMVQPLLHESRRVGLAVLVYEPATAAGGVSMAVLFLAFLVLTLSTIIALLSARKMTLVPVADLRDDVEAVVKGDADYVLPRQGFAELTELATSINRMIARSHRMQAAARSPATAGSRPQPPKAAPASPAPVSPAPEAPPSRSSSRHRPVTRVLDQRTDASTPRFWVDDQFIVVRADAAAATIAGASAAGMEGKHLIEAVADQELLAAVLDAVNALDTMPDAEAVLERSTGPSLRVSATRSEGETVVGLHEL